MRRTLLLLAGTLLAGAAVLALHQLDDEWRYRRLLATGDQHLAGGQSYLAVEAYSGALGLRPDSMVAHYRRGEAYAAGGQPAQALRDLKRAQRVAPDAPEPAAAIGRLYERRGDHAAAALWYRDATARLGDTDSRLLYALALACYRTGALPAAADAIRRALARDPMAAAAYYLQALIARDLGRAADAVAALDQALRLDPTLLEARRELANLEASLGRFDRQASHLDRLPRQDDNPGLQVAAAVARFRAGETAGALADLATLELAGGADSRATLALGRLRLILAERTGDPTLLESARATLERALGGTVGRSEGLALYARALHLSGRLDEAGRLLREAIRTSPVHPAAFAYLADVAEQLGRPAEARAALVALTALDGGVLSADALRHRRQRIDRVTSGAEVVARADEPAGDRASSRGASAPADEDAVHRLR